MIKSASAMNLNAIEAINCSVVTMGNIKKSQTTANCVVEKKRGFMPSDRHDPIKRQFLTELSQQIWHKKIESTNVSKKIDLNKIFTPAADTEEILPKNRKLYASSAFYSPSLHPTVEDQVELARRISHSLSDISNHQSRGQSMYVNRKKRSVKWVHEGSAQDESENAKIANEEECDPEEKENVVIRHAKIPLKFLMNPSGQIRDINSLREPFNTETGLLSPDVSAEVVTALQAQKGKGAELFAKRRKVSEKWIVDENNVGAQSPSGLPDYHQYQQQPKPPTSPSILPAYTDAAKYRVQLNLHQEQLLEKYAKPGLKVVQTPWEAALNSGSASVAFVEEKKLSPYLAPTLTPSPTPQIFDASQGGVPSQTAMTYSTDEYQRFSAYSAPQKQAQHERQQYCATNAKRELAYKPCIPQGWRAPSMSLPKERFEDHKKIEINCTAKKNESYQREQVTTTSAAVRSYEESNTKDERELMELLRNDNIKIESAVNNCAISELQSSKHLSNTQLNELQYNQVPKSPELRVSPIPLSTEVFYDKAVEELHEKHLKEAKKSIGTSCDRQNEEKEKKINVREQLQQYENLHRQYALQIEQEKHLQQKREVAKLKRLQQNGNKLALNHLNDDYINGLHDDHKSTLLRRTEQQDSEEYVKVPVKDLITNFEYQCLQDDKTNMRSVIDLKENNNVELEHQIEGQTDEIAKKLYEDLYMPKEIPLQSYAPPPVVAIPPSISPFSANATYDAVQFNNYKPLSCSNVSPYILPDSVPAMTKSFGGNNSLPNSKPFQQGFASAYGNSQPPKQQYLPPESYQKVPQSTTQNLPHVSFNPSPLPYDKLAKFENQLSDDGHYINSPSSEISHLNVRGSKVRNTSPAPFACCYHKPHVTSSDGHYYDGSLRGHNTTLAHSTVTPTEMLNAPSYNTSARGWGCGDRASTRYRYPQSLVSNTKSQIVNAAYMPYTDF